MQESPLQLSSDIHKVKKHWESMIILKKLIKSSAKHCNSEKFCTIWNVLWNNNFWKNLTEGNFLGVLLKCMWNETKPVALIFSLLR